MNLKRIMLNEKKDNNLRIYSKILLYKIWEITITEMKNSLVAAMI